MNNITIIGAGFSTAVLCHYLNDKNITVIEKARGPGGRSSTRKVDDIGVFDHGLQYISSKDQEFLDFTKGIKGVKKWDGDFVEIDGRIIVLPPKEKLIGGNGNNDFVKAKVNLEQCYFKTRIEKIHFIDDHWKLIDDNQSEHLTKKLILTLPQEQTNNLIKDLKLNFEIKDNFMKPCFTVMLAVKQSPIFKHSGYIIKNNPIISWCANETSKQRKINNNDLTLLTIQTTEQYGFANFEQYRENKDKILTEILNEFVDIFKIDDSEVVHKDIHGWLYAFSEDRSFPVFWDQAKGLGITGDWLTGGRAENAWKNAKLLAEKINH